MVADVAGLNDGAFPFVLKGERTQLIVRRAQMRIEEREELVGFSDTVWRRTWGHGTVESQSEAAWLRWPAEVVIRRISLQPGIVEGEPIRDFDAVVHVVDMRSLREARFSRRRRRPRRCRRWAPNS